MIRIHRASVKDFAGKRQMHVNCGFNATWVLYSLSTEGVDHQGGNTSDNDSENGGNFQGRYKPYRFSGKAHSFDPQVEKPILKYIRSWAQDYLNANSVIHKSSSTPLSECHSLPEKKEVDLLVKIIKVFERDEYSLELRVKDLSQESWPMTLNKMMNVEQFQPGDVYRVRGVYAEQTAERAVITTKQSTNFLKFSRDTMVFRELTIGVKDDIEEEDEDELLLHPKIVTRVTTEPEHDFMKKELKFYKLQDLFTDYDSLTDEEKERNYFRVRM